MQIFGLTVTRTPKARKITCAGCKREIEKRAGMWVRHGVGTYCPGPGHQHFTELDEAAHRVATLEADYVATLEADYEDYC